MARSISSRIAVNAGTVPWWANSVGVASNPRTAAVRIVVFFMEHLVIDTNLGDFKR